MLTIPRTLTVALVAVLLVLSGCSSDEDGPGDDNGGLRPGDIVLTDDLDLDSYLIEGTIDGVNWGGEVCALSLTPWFEVYVNGTPDSVLRMRFEAFDSSNTGGVVLGQWRLGGDVPVAINTGTWSKSVSADGQSPGTISLDLAVTEYQLTSSVDRSVTGTLTLTPVVTSEQCVAENDVDYLREILENYEGPTGG